MDMTRKATNLTPADLADAAPAHGREIQARRFIPAALELFAQAEFQGKDLGLLR